MARTESTLDNGADQPEVLNATRARQGSRGLHILWILIISVVLAALALFGVLAFNKDEIDGGGGQTTTPAGAQAFDTVPGSNQTPPSTPPAP